MSRYCSKDRETSSTQARTQYYKSPNTLIVSGYTCIGKTTLQRRTALRDNLLGLPDEVQVIDMDSSAYSRDNFPANYLADIRHRADENENNTKVTPRILLISTFPGVATQLKAEGYYVAQLYPDKSLETKREWLRRLAEREERRTESRLYKLVNEMWDVWYDEMEVRDVSFSVRVGADTYLSTEIGNIYKNFLRGTKEYEEGDIDGHER